MDLAYEIGKICQGFPDYEKFGLGSQLRRASISIPSNISEGSSRKSTKDFVRYLRMALGSSFEVETQLLLANRSEYVQDDHLAFELNNKVQRMLWNFIEKLEKEE